MANGKNAGRLFADCEGELGYGESHSIVTEDDQPVLWNRGDVPQSVKCRVCGRRFTLTPDGDLIPEGEVA